MIQEEKIFIEFKVDNFTIKLNRGNIISHDKDIKLLSQYVSKICEFGQRQEIESKKCSNTG